jgi:hypothetical protein
VTLGGCVDHTPRIARNISLWGTSQATEAVRERFPLGSPAAAMKIELKREGFQLSASANAQGWRRAEIGYGDVVCNKGFIVDWREDNRGLIADLTADNRSAAASEGSEPCVLERSPFCASRSGSVAA